MSTTSDDDNKTPTEQIDEEEKENNPVKETQDILEHEIELEKKAREKKEKEEKEKREAEKTEAERHRDEVRCKIDLITYEHRLEGLEEHLEMEKKRSRMRLEGDLEDLEHQVKKRRINNEKDLLSAQINLKNKKKEWKEWVDREPEYLMNPMIELDNGEVELILSDRIIELSGVITYYTSEYITERIHYYNNQNPEYPIFLVIDHSPGGSVMSGYRILTAMESSQAPVYVVVKSFAASMAATITTMAKYSFVYPNAIMLHHQIWSRSCGNLRQQEEQLDDLKEWWKRLAEPIARRLKLTTRQWRTMMYEKNSDGDWREFGDQAVKLGWADYLVHRLRKTAKDHHPDKEITSFCFFCRTHSDHQNHSPAHEKYLPELRPLDYYWIYNPNQYYQITSI